MKSTVTIRDIARKAGVSTATVSRYINRSGYVSAALQARIGAVIKELDFIPNRVAISLKTTATRIIGIVTPELSNVSLMDTIKAIIDVAVSSGYQPMILSSGEDIIKERKILDVLISQQVDGIIIASTGNSGERLLKINDQRLPVVLFDRDVCNEENHVVLDAVVNDNFNGSYQMISYLLSLNHRNIAILSSNRDQPHMNLRVKGYIKAFEDHHVPVDPNLIRKSDLDFKSGYEETKRLMSESSVKPTAIFVLNNIAALGVVCALNELHIQIPQDISICGFGEFKYHSILKPDLSVVYQSSYELGKIAAEILMEKINYEGVWKPKKFIIPANILLRDSCAPPKGRLL